MMAHLPAMSLLRSTLEVLCKLGLLAGMFVIRTFYDTLQGRPTPGFSLPILLVLTAVLGLSDLTLGLLRNGVGGALGFRISAWLRQNLLAHILARPGARALPGTVGEALSTLDDDADSLEYVSMLPLDLFTYALFYGGGLVILLLVDVQVTLLVILPMLAILLLSRVGRKRLEQMRVQSREAAARFTGGLGEVLATVQAVQVAGAEDRVVVYLRGLSERRQRAALRDQLQQCLWDALFRLPWVAGNGLVLLAASAKMRSGDFSVGDLALFVAYLGEVGELVFFGGKQLIQVQVARVAVERLLALLRSPTQLDEGSPANQRRWVQEKLDGAKPSNPAALGASGAGRTRPPYGTSDSREQLVASPPLILRKPLPPLISPVKTTRDRLETLHVNQLTLRHAGSGGGIEDVSFALQRGTLTAVTGRIGAGKTTLLRAMLGLLPIDGGEVCWNGERVDDLAAFCVPPRVAYTPQVPILLSDTLRENILLGWPEEEQRMADALHRAVLEPDLVTFSEGLDTVIGVRGKRLSGGQIQRTAAARMLVREPELFVIDDLSSALDVETEALLWKRILALGTTCLVTSHRREVLERADQVLFLDRGRITARGTLQELLASNDEVRRLYMEP
jgi:ATP-binding cassette subfamily B protein